MRIAEKLGIEQQMTIGHVISDLARQTLTRNLSIKQLPIRNGFRYLPKRGDVW